MCVYVAACVTWGKCALFNWREVDSHMKEKNGIEKWWEKDDVVSGNSLWNMGRKELQVKKKTNKFFPLTFLFFPEIVSCPCLLSLYCVYCLSE